MPKIKYIDKRFTRSRLELINQVNKIIADYDAQGLSLTLRQVYYRLVAAGIIPNNEKSYKNIGNMINDARLAGYIDWFAIEDRTRGLVGRIQYENPSDFIQKLVSSYHLNYWEDQENYVEVWVEKDALKSIIGRACYPYDVDYFSCRGYTSQSEMWVAGRRLRGKLQEGFENVVILHFGDHDPSGLDMSRDIKERLEMFGVHSLEFKRIALNMDQIEQYNPPENPAKLTDSRVYKYMDEFGSSSWELDALEPQVIIDLIQQNIEYYIDPEILEPIQMQERCDSQLLKEISQNWGLIETNWNQIKEDYRG